MSLDWLRPFSEPFGRIYKKKPRRPWLSPATSIVPQPFAPIDYLPLASPMVGVLPLNSIMSDRAVAVQASFPDPTAPQSGGLP